MPYGVLTDIFCIILGGGDCQTRETFLLWNVQ